MSSSSPHSPKRVSYFYDQTFGDFHYGQGHPMKPHRIEITHNLIVGYGLYKKMQVYRPHMLCPEEMTKFHNEDYIQFLSKITPSNQDQYIEELKKYGFIKGECPVFRNLFNFCQLSAGASVAGAINLNKQEGEIAINWAGGLHHSKKDSASGFCYVNDIILAILELLKYHQRVLYVDIDVHHGDGVEEAFYATDRVMTVSFHKFAPKFFPETGSLNEIGVDGGKYYSVNVPLKNGIDDQSYQSVFQPVMSKVMETYCPNAVVLQCGADSLVGDRLGGFNMTLRGHGYCVEFMRKYNLPLLLLGGGGYKMMNVVRCWTYETALALGVEIENKLPFCSAYSKYIEPGSVLHIKAKQNLANANTREYLDEIRVKVMENLREIGGPPGIPMKDIPEDAPVKLVKEKVGCKE